MGFKLALILDCVIVGGLVAWLTDDGEWIVAVISGVISTLIVSAVKWLFSDGAVRYGLDFFLLLIPMTIWGTAVMCDDSPSSSCYGGGSVRSYGSDTEFTVLWNDKYHIIQIYSGEDVYADPLYEIDMKELEKANYSVGNYVYIRDARTRDIEYTLIPGKTYGNTYVVRGSSQYGEIEYTINGEYICKGEDNLNQNVIYRIRDGISSDRKIVERYTL